MEAVRQSPSQPDTPVLVVMLVLGWAVLPGSPWLWTTIALGVLALPLLKWLIGAVLGYARTLSLASLSSWRNSVPNMAGQTLLAVVFLADQARLMCDAVVRTLARLLVTRRRLLEWETAASAEQRLGTGLAISCLACGELSLWPRQTPRWWRSCGHRRFGPRALFWRVGSSRRSWRSGSAVPSRSAT